jgi:hypothetical protein
MSKLKITPGYLHECFVLNSEVGALTWKARPVTHFSNSMRHRQWVSKWAHRAAGWVSDRGYCMIRVGGISTSAHRVIWEMTNGPIPDGMEIDHANGVKNDNRPLNLRLVTRRQNSQNKGVRADSRTRLKGILRNAGSKNWSAVITVEGRKVHLGSFPTKLLAHDAYIEAAIKYHGTFANF